MLRFSIRSSTVRFGIFMSALIITIIMVFQLIWLTKVYRKEQKDFDISVFKATAGLYEDLDITLYRTFNLNSLIERPEQHLYLARMPLPVNTDTLTTYLQYELENFDIFTNCVAGLYDSKKDKYIFTTTLLAAGTTDKSPLAIPSAIKKNYDYIALYFPNRQHYIIYQMNFWIVSTVILLIVLIISGGSLYFFYRQKFLNETQKDFVQNFTHEFKTPVATIALAAETLENKNIIEKPGKLATYAGIIKYQSDYLGKQIEKLLRFAHIESGKLHLSKTPVNLHSLIKESITNISPLVEQKNAVLDLQLEAKNPSLMADKDYLIILITNIIENALKYSREPFIVITTGNKPGMLVLSISDNGAGISKKELKKIFTKFYRIRYKEEQPARGFGIGLTFVKKIIDAHKGKIFVESEEGKGSRFTVELPQA